MGNTHIFGFFMVVLLLGDAHGAATLQDQCSSEFEKVTTCLTFVSGKAAVPTKDCCKSISDLKESKPACLCYVIEETHNGSATIKSLGIQEAKLVQLPSACQLQNASLSVCPKLLGLSPSSPYASIFLNATTSAPSPMTTVVPPTTATNSTPSSAVMTFTALSPAIVMLVSSSVALLCR